MIDINKAKQFLDNYISKYDLEDEQIRLKKEHIYRVSNLSETLAFRLNLEKEDVILAELIGLLHDIGRFEQIRRYHTFIDKDSVNHGELGCEILFKDGLIRDFLDDNKYDEIIKESILNHNRPSINSNTSGKSLLHSKIIRDADKTDILYLSSLEENLGVVFGKKIFDEKISDKVYNDFISNSKINYKNLQTGADVVLCHLAYVFDYNFPELLFYINEEGYIDKLYDMINFNDKKSNSMFNDCYTKTKKYIKERLYTQK